MVENMFSKQAKYKEARSIDECVKMDAVSEELWYWSANTERWGKILFYGFIIWGIISSIIVSLVFDEFGTEVKGWNGLLFFSNLIEYALYAFIEYVTYHAIALLLASLATITQNTRVTAKLEEYKARKAENAFTDTNKKDNGVKSQNAVKKDETKSYDLSKIAQETAKEKPKNGWTCSKCGYINESSEVTCKSCGQYK